MIDRTGLAEFLRRRRGSLQPEDIGLPRGQRRRTVGLRREEVASLSGVSVTWYTWLEQGRDISPSRQVLDAVARTLRLSDAEPAMNVFAEAAAPRLRAVTPHPAVVRPRDAVGRR